MKAFAFSTILFIYVAINCVNEILAHDYDYIREYYSDVPLVNTIYGCNLEHSENLVKSRLVKVGKPYGKNKKRQTKTPLEKPFISKIDCNSATEEQCKQVHDAFDYALQTFAKAIDFYEPVIIKIFIENTEKLDYIAATDIPLSYTLKDPDEASPFTYPISLVKQFDVDRPIKFNQKNDYDISISINVNALVQKNHIEATLVHEILHGLGFHSIVRPITDGLFENNVPSVGGNYYLQALLKVEDPEAGVSIINGFRPINIFERHFVEYQNPDHYLFGPLFNSLSNEHNLDITVHSQPFYSERRNLEKLADLVRNWQGMGEAEDFYKISHKANTFAFRTKDNVLVTICSFEDGSDADINHVCSQNFVLNSPNNFDWKGKIDQNFVIYRANVNLSSTPEEKISQYGPNNKFGLLSDDIISVLSTIGYHKKGDPVAQKTYQFITDNTMVTQTTNIDGSNAMNIQKIKAINKAKKSAAMSNISTNRLILCIYTILSIFVILF